MFPFTLECDRPAREIDPRALWLARVFLFRKPLADEDAALVAAIRGLRRRWLWVVCGYLFAFLPLLVFPGLLRDRSLGYYATSVVLPHLMLYLLAMMAAYSWVGFRVNLSSYKKFLPDVIRERRRKASIVTALAMLVAGGLVGFVAGMAAVDVGSHISQWIRDTFTPPVLTVLFAMTIVLLPELIAQLRLREHNLSERVRASEAVSERLGRQRVEAELRLLQAQVEPHFLYNTLANLRYLVSSKSADALRMTDALIDYLRTSVPDMRAERVTLGRELDRATHYLELMQMRMGGRLTFVVSAPEALRTVEIPPLMVLTLVENAIKHGVSPRVEGGEVRVEADALDDGRIRITVADTGAGTVGPIRIMDIGEARAAMAEQDAAAQPRQSTQTGLASVRGRLSLTYGEKAQLQLRPNTPRGVIAEIVIPTLAQSGESGGSVRVLYARNDRELQTIAGQLVEKLSNPDLR